MKLFIVIIMSILADKSLDVNSTAFAHKDYIPAKYTCKGSNINPALTIKNIPKETKTLALIMDDPDAPNGTYDHWIMWNIPVKDKIAENSAPGVQGKNGKNENKYTGPCPPTGTHHYHFKVYALDTKLSLTAGADKKTLQTAMEGHVLASGELIGLFKK